MQSDCFIVSGVLKMQLDFEPQVLKTQERQLAAKRNCTHKKTVRKELSIEYDNFGWLIFIFVYKSYLYSHFNPVVDGLSDMSYFSLLGGKTPVAHLVTVNK